MMSATENNQIILLSPGEIYFGYSPKIIKTLLGSCVAMTVWHKKLLIGGMCHYLMADDHNKASNTENLYKYGNHALQYLLHQMSAFSALEEYEINLYGGSNMYIKNTHPSIGELNVDFALNWLKQHKLQLMNNDTLGHMSRKITFDLSIGSVEVLHHDI